MRAPPIFKDSAVVNIKVDGDPFHVPWRLELRRPNMKPYQAECVVIMDQMANGDPHLRIVWKGQRSDHPADVMRLLEEALSKHIQEMLPEANVLPAPDPN